MKLPPSLLAERDQALERVRELEFCLENKSKEIGRSEHRGNTVDYIYDKCETYGKQLVQLGPENAALRERCAAYEKALEEVVNQLRLSTVSKQSDKGLALAAAREALKKFEG